MEPLTDQELTALGIDPSWYASQSEPQPAPDLTTPALSDAELASLGIDPSWYGANVYTPGVDC